MITYYNLETNNRTRSIITFEELVEAVKKNQCKLFMLGEGYMLYKVPNGYTYLALEGEYD